MSDPRKCRRGVVRLYPLLSTIDVHHNSSALSFSNMSAVEAHGPQSLDATAQTTIDLLELRLHRLHVAVTGSDEYSETPKLHISVADKIRELERSLAKLSSDSVAISQLLALSMPPEPTDFLHDVADRPHSGSKHPQLFIPESNPSNHPDIPSETLLPIILANASLYHATASQLTSLENIPLHSASTLLPLITISDRLLLLEQSQASQSRQVAELRRRSADVLKRWYELSVLGGQSAGSIGRSGWKWLKDV